MPKASRLVAALGVGFLLLLALALVLFWIGSPAAEGDTQGHTDSGTRDIPTARGSERIVVAIAGPRTPESYLHIVALDGSGHRRLTTSAGSTAIVGDSSPVSSPDGRRIAFVRTLFEPGGQGQSHLYVAAFDGTGVRRISRGRADEKGAAWAPDGRRLVFARALRNGFGVVVGRLGRPGPEILVRPGNTLSDATSPAWSPDGRTIAFTAYVDDNEDLFTVDADGSGLAPLLSGPNRDSQPAWSPDGRRLAFVRDGDVYTVNADGTNMHAVTSG